MPDPPTGDLKRRKPRPSRARGLRTTTGCLTCRKRRVKCDETRPRCGPCAKSSRGCNYSCDGVPTDTVQQSLSAREPPTQPRGPEGLSSILRTNILPSVAYSARQKSIATDIDPRLFGDSPELRFDLSPLTIAASLPSPNSAPFEWYDLLAEDAINNIQKHNLGFDQGALSRRQSPVPESSSRSIEFQPHTPQENGSEPIITEPWSSREIIPLSNEDLILFQHFVHVVGPILDLYDPLRHFSTHVPRLAVHNLGLLKSLLAVAARHRALNADTFSQQVISNGRTSPGESNPNLQTATQYYYETLHYLSQNLLYPSYSKSGEIIATAILISTYEMFDSEGSYNDGGWERHLRGIFWIQRSQDNNGESADGLRRAAWWSWLRQDIWVAFRENRRVLTIWRPTKRLKDLSCDELATRIVYIAARCVDFTANEKHYEINIRIDQGDKLLQALQDWYSVLPPSFQPLYTLPVPEVGFFAPVWIHPPSYAAAIQMFHFGRIIVLINQPSLGGMAAFRQRQRFLDESVDTICGIAMMHQGRDLPSAFVDIAAVYAAGLCVQTPVKQQAIVQLLEKTIDVTKFPPKSILNDLARYWRVEA